MHEHLIVLLRPAMTTAETTQPKYFRGFLAEPKFVQLFRRLEYLETWRELAIRPSRDDCDPDDHPLLDNELDDCVELDKRCAKVRRQMNERLPPIEEVLDSDLVAKPSQIPAAGMGLFYEGTRTIQQGETLCYYTGHIHSFRSARQLMDKSYLMMVQKEVLVDPREVISIKARFINDPLDEDFVNCEFVPEELRSAVVAKRDIDPGTELFVSYGEGYWTQHSEKGTILSTQNQKP